MLATGRAKGANERIRIGLIGTGGRCMGLAGHLKTLPGNEVLLTSDVYEPRRLAAAEKMGPQARPARDYREVLDNKDIDAVVIGAPDHWHVPMTLDAVAAGKDVYCEKPVTHDVSEGDKLISAVEKSGRVMATGTQQRSWEHYIMAKHLVDSGKLGQITLAQCYWYQNYLNARQPDAMDTSRLDWKQWLGNAKDQPFSPVKYRRWRFFWDFGGGAFTDLMTHWIDVIQWFMNSPTLVSVTASGSTHACKDLECPDTVIAAIEFPGYSATYHGTMTCALEDGGIVFRGTQAMMKLTRGGFSIIPEGSRTGEPEIQVKSMGDGTRTNLANWLDCIRSRKTPNANVRAGVEAARTSHLANMAMRQKRVISV